MPTESIKYNPDVDDETHSTTDVPVVKTESRTVTYQSEDGAGDSEPGVLVSAQSHATRTQTIETTTVRLTTFALCSKSGSEFHGHCSSPTLLLLKCTNYYYYHYHYFYFNFYYYSQYLYYFRLSFVVTLSTGEHTVMGRSGWFSCHMSLLLFRPS